MGGWLTKKVSTALTRQGGGLPVKKGQNQAVGLWAGLSQEKIPNASLIYGAGAAVLFAFSFYHFFTGSWLIGFLLSVLAIGLLGYALHYMNYL